MTLTAYARAAWHFVHLALLEGADATTTTTATATDATHVVMLVCAAIGAASILAWAILAALRFLRAWLATLTISALTLAATVATFAPRAILGDGMVVSHSAIWTAHVCCVGGVLWLNNSHAPKAPVAPVANEPRCCGGCEHQRMLLTQLLLELGRRRGETPQ